MRLLRLGWLSVLTAAVVLSRALSAQQPAARDSTPSDSTHRDSSSFVRRLLNFDHIGVALGPSVTLTRFGWARRDQVSPGIAGGFFRGAGFGSQGRAGLVPAFKFDIFPKHVSVVDTTGANGSALGTVRMRSLMAGLGWSQPLGKSVSAVITGVAGETFNSFSSSTSNTHAAPLDVAAAPVSIGDSMAWEVSGRVWHRLRPSTVILMGVSYYRTRPELRFADGTQRPSNFDTVRADVGIAFTIYHR